MASIMTAIRNYEYNYLGRVYTNRIKEGQARCLTSNQRPIDSYDLQQLPGLESSKLKKRVGTLYKQNDTVSTQHREIIYCEFEPKNSSAASFLFTRVFTIIYTHDFFVLFFFPSGVQTHKTPSKNHEFCIFFLFRIRLFREKWIILKYHTSYGKNL